MVSQKYFGSELDHTLMEKAEKMGSVVSRLFVSRFYNAQYDPIVYFSINKIDEYDGKHVLSLHTLLWDIEIPLLRKLGTKNIHWRSVMPNGLIKEVPLADLDLVRNRFFPNPLQDRRFYTCGMPELPEWLLYSAQPPRPTTSVQQLLEIAKTWRKKSTDRK